MVGVGRRLRTASARRLPDVPLPSPPLATLVQATPYKKLQWSVLNSFIALLGDYCAAWLVDKSWCAPRLFVQGLAAAFVAPWGPTGSVRLLRDAHGGAAGMAAA